MDEAVVYRSGNEWQRQRYAFMADYLHRRGVRRFGRSRGGSFYRHLLTEDDAIHNFLGDESIHYAVRRRFSTHTAGDLARALTNTTASTPFCFNLFVPLQNDLRLAGAIVSVWLGKPVKVAHVEIEFTPNRCEVPGFVRHEDESLGDQSGSTGTDADVAIFYAGTDGARGVILIETKYIEDGFSRCKSYDNKAHIRSTCDAPDFYERLVRPHLARPSSKPECGYLRYANWSLTKESRILDAEAIAGAGGCPFRGSTQQVWRNLLLAERVAMARQLEELHFCVLSPAENIYLWEDGDVDVERAVRTILTARGNHAFRRLELKVDVLEPLRWLVGMRHHDWLARLVERYVPQ